MNFVKDFESDWYLKLADAMTNLETIVEEKELNGWKLFRCWSNQQIMSDDKQLLSAFVHFRRSKLMELFAKRDTLSHIDQNNPSSGSVLYAEFSNEGKCYNLYLLCTQNRDYQIKGTRTCSHMTPFVEVEGYQ